MKQLTQEQIDAFIEKFVKPLLSPFVYERYSYVLFIDESSLFTFYASNSTLTQFIALTCIRISDSTTLLLGIDKVKENADKHPVDLFRTSHDFMTDDLDSEDVKIQFDDARDAIATVIKRRQARLNDRERSSSEHQDESSIPKTTKEKEFDARSNR